MRSSFVEGSLTSTSNRRPRRLESLRVREDIFVSVCRATHRNVMTMLRVSTRIRFKAFSMIVPSRPQSSANEAAAMGTWVSEPLYLLSLSLCCFSHNRMLLNFSIGVISPNFWSFVAAFSIGQATLHMAIFLCCRSKLRFRLRWPASAH